MLGYSPRPDTKELCTVPVSPVTELQQYSAETPNLPVHEIFRDIWLGGRSVNPHLSEADHERLDSSVSVSARAGIRPRVLPRPRLAGTSPRI